MFSFFVCVEFFPVCVFFKKQKNPATSHDSAQSDIEELHGICVSF